MAADQGDNDGVFPLGDQILQRIDSALSTTVIEDIKHSHYEARFSKGSIIFELKALLEEFVETVKKSDPIAREKDKAEQRANPQQVAVSGTAIHAQVKAAVEEEVAKKVGDLQIENSRLREEVQALKNRFTPEIAGAKKGKTAKLTTEDDLKDINRQIKAVEAQVKKFKDENTALKDKVATLQTKEQTLMKAHEIVKAEKTMICNRSALDQRVENIDRELQAMEGRLCLYNRAQNGVNTRVKAIGARPPPRVHTCSVPETVSELTNHTRDLAADVLAQKDKISRLQHKFDWLKEERDRTVGQFAELGELVTGFRPFQWASQGQKERIEKLCGRKSPGDVP